MTRDAFEEERLEAAAYAKRIERALQPPKPVRRAARIYVGGRLVGEIADGITLVPPPVGAIVELSGAGVPPVHPSTPKQRINGQAWAQAVLCGNDVYCAICAACTPFVPGPPEPIEANSVWNDYPCCVKCGTVHRYVRLEHEVCSHCDDTGIDTSDGSPCACKGEPCGACGETSGCDCAAVSYRR